MPSVPERILAAHRSWKSCALKFPRADATETYILDKPSSNVQWSPLFSSKWRRSILHRSSGDSVAGSGHGQKPLRCPQVRHRQVNRHRNMIFRRKRPFLILRQLKLQMETAFARRKRVWGERRVLLNWRVWQKTWLAAMPAAFEIGLSLRDHHQKADARQEISAVTKCRGSKSRSGVCLGETTCSQYAEVGDSICVLLWGILFAQ